MVIAKIVKFLRINAIYHYIVDNLIPNILTSLKMTKALEKYNKNKNRLHKIKSILQEWRKKLKAVLNKDIIQNDNKKNDKIYTEDDINVIKSELEKCKTKMKTIKDDLDTEKPKTDTVVKEPPKIEPKTIITEPELETVAEVYSAPNFSNGKDSVSKAFKHIMKNMMTSDEHDELKNLLKLKENNKGSSMENISAQ